MKSTYTKILFFYLPVLILLIACNEEITVSLSPNKIITKFSFSGLTPAVNATIDEANKKITAVVPATVDITKLTPTIIVSEGARVTPNSGKAQDFSKEVAYTVTAEDGSTTTYKVLISRTKFTGKDILSFSFNDLSPVITASIDPITKIITETVPAPADITKLKVTTTFSERASIFPASGTILDFSKPISFTVTAEDGTTQVYTAKITKEAPVSTSTLPTSITYIPNALRASIKSTIKLTWDKGVLIKMVENNGTLTTGRTFKRNKDGLITAIEISYSDGTVVSETYSYSEDKMTITAWKTRWAYNDNGLLTQKFTPEANFGSDAFVNIKWNVQNNAAKETYDGSLVNIISSWTKIKNPLWEITKQTQFLLIQESNPNTTILYLGEILPVGWFLKYDFSSTTHQADITPTLDSQGRITRIVVNQGLALAQDMSISYE